MTTSATFGRLYLSPLLPEFLALHPAVKVSVDLNDRVVDLVTAGFDLAIRIGALDDSTMVARKLAPNRRVLVASPDYLQRRGAPKTPPTSRPTTACCSPAPRAARTNGA